MTITATPVAAPDSSADPTIRQRLHRVRWLLATGAVLVAASIGFAYYGSTVHGGTLDPRSYDAGGSHALSALLAQRGVSVTTVSDPASAIASARPGVTLVVVRPDFLDADQLQQIADSRADVVVVGADQPVVNALGHVTSAAAIVANKTSNNQTTDPGCSWPAASVAGPADLGAIDYVGGAAVLCYPDAGGYGYGIVSIDDGARSFTLLGDPTPLQNSALADEGNAALSVGLLDSNRSVIWLLPTAAVPGAVGTGQNGSTAATASLTSLLPSRLKQALVQLVIAIVVVALWRGRRFGRLVHEELPVVVRRAEVVVGRARLYQRSKSRDSASGALRAGSRDRLARRLRFGAGADPQLLVDAVAIRTSRPAADIGALLYGATPVDDRSLVALSQALSVLEQEVSRT